jgi:hypothetical protein
MDTLCVAMGLATFMANSRQLHATETALVLNPLCCHFESKYIFFIVQAEKRKELNVETV